MDRLQLEHKYFPSYITLDEMKVRDNLVIKQGELVGFVEGIHGTDAKLASHILVFYVRSIKRELSLPMAWYPTRSAPAEQLALIFWELLYECEKRNVQIHAVVADQKHGCPKLTPNLIHFLKYMKVGLAKDTLSWKVGQCLKLMPNAEGTANYVLMFDRKLHFKL
ncbi:uncharacterized protein LOC108949295 [Ciona intestinalis]